MNFSPFVKSLKAPSKSSFPDPSFAILEMKPINSSKDIFPSLS